MGKFSLGKLVMTRAVHNKMNSVIDWILSVFSDVDSTMCGLSWGDLYERYREDSYNPQGVSNKVQALLGEDYIKDNKGIYEYILGDCVDFKLLNVRVFDEPTKKSVYTQQTKEAQDKGISNCPLCAIGNNANKSRIWNQNEMDSDHITACSKKGGRRILRIIKYFAKAIIEQRGIGKNS